MQSSQPGSRWFTQAAITVREPQSWTDSAVMAGILKAESSAVKWRAVSGGPPVFARAALAVALRDGGRRVSGTARSVGAVTLLPDETWNITLFFYLQHEKTIQLMEYRRIFHCTVTQKRRRGRKSVVFPLACATPSPPCPPVATSNRCLASHSRARIDSKLANGEIRDCPVARWPHQ